MNVLITGSDGFIAKNLILRINSVHPKCTILKVNRKSSFAQLDKYVKEAEIIFHLAGENRPKKVKNYDINNRGFTESLAKSVKKNRSKAPIIFSSSTQALESNPYGKSKLAAETILLDLNKKNNVPIKIVRLCGVFGKWSKPNYNSVVSTFCYNFANDITSKINEGSKKINLVYIDDVIDSFMSHLTVKTLNKNKYFKIKPTYAITVGKLHKKLQAIASSINNISINDYGGGLNRKLYATYLSYLNKKDFTFKYNLHTDERGAFAEILKAGDYGQVSFFTCKPGQTRGEHFHDTKNERFFVVSGKALFKFKDPITKKISQLTVSHTNRKAVHTIPGIVHNIKNIGKSELVVILWANEVFNKEKPDTFFYKI